MNRQTDDNDDDDFVTVEDDQTVDVALDRATDGAVAVRFRPGVILTPKLAALISRAHRDSKTLDICRPRKEDEQPPDA
ncbi:hypothetical protein BBK82_10620 [Lentzea guizhouensis]|uniref:Uncharacterized protein n=1 Tax=Lentzea guizhouensis TaxID=1586287 RepID=A0A1B2HFH8_9PSEU|nr:hypothetical protein [Lentzea guizhouensis]ANZ36450.1 hypothetical protein BBK82_10620 [Lentzea guizhouensis]